MPRKLFVYGALAAIIAASAAYSQSRPDPEAVQQELEEKAVRIPARALTAALTTREELRTDRPRLLEKAPDLAELRRTLEEARAADATDNVRQSELSASPSALQPPPRPGVRALAESRLAAREESEIAQVFVPLLLPADLQIRDKFRVYGMRNIYTATAAVDTEATVSISGTCNRVIGGDPEMRARRELPEALPQIAETGAQYQISKNDFGAELSFSKFGCGYVITIECNDPASDARCAGDDFIKRLASSLVVANPEIVDGEQ